MGSQAKYNHLKEILERDADTSIGQIAEIPDQSERDKAAREWFISTSTQLRVLHKNALQIIGRIKS